MAPRRGSGHADVAVGPTIRPRNLTQAGPAGRRAQHVRRDRRRLRHGAQPAQRSQPVRRQQDLQRLRPQPSPVAVQPGKVLRRAWGRDVLRLGLRLGIRGADPRGKRRPPAQPSVHQAYHWPRRRSASSMRMRRKRAWVAVSRPSTTPGLGHTRNRTASGASTPRSAPRSGASTEGPARWACNRVASAASRLRSRRLGGGRRGGALINDPPPERLPGRMHPSHVGSDAPRRVGESAPGRFRVTAHHRGAAA